MIVNVGDEKKLNFKIRPEFRCRISQTNFFLKHALGRQDSTEKKCKFKACCGSCVQTFDTRFLQIFLARLGSS